MRRERLGTSCGRSCSSSGSPSCHPASQHHTWRSPPPRPASQPHQRRPAHCLLLLALTTPSSRGTSRFLGTKPAPMPCGRRGASSAHQEVGGQRQQWQCITMASRHPVAQRSEQGTAPRQVGEHASEGWCCWPATSWPAPYTDAHPHPPHLNLVGARVAAADDRRLAGLNGKHLRAPFGGMHTMCR